MMANIGFTDKQLHVYTRFQDMRRAYEDAHGRTYAPGFLTVLMDALNVINQLNTAREEWVKTHPKSTVSFVIEPGENGEVQFWRIEEDAPGQERWTELLPPVSLRAYIADAEANEWNDSKVILPNIGDKVLVEFPSGKTHRAIYYEHDGFDVYLDKGEGVRKSGFYLFFSMTCIRWKLNDFKEPENETE